MKDFSDEKDALVKDEEVLAGIDGAATATAAPAAGSPLEAVKTKLEAAYGANGTKAAPAAGSTGKTLATEQAKLPGLKAAVETAKKDRDDAKAAHDKAEATRRSLVPCSSDILRLKRKIRKLRN